MRIVVMGAGAMGGAWGARLHRGGLDVTLVDVDEKIVRAINDQGLELETANEKWIERLPATTSAAELGTVDLVIVFVKSMHTVAAVRAAAPLIGEKTLFLTLQNGLGNAEAIADEVGPERVIAGVTYDSAALAGPGKVRLTNSGATFIGELDGPSSSRVERVVAAFAGAGISAEPTDNGRGLIWGKVLINSVFNATCAITGYLSGEIGKHAPALEWAALVGAETAAVASAVGVQLPYDDPVEKVLQTAKGAGASKASMLQDIEAGRLTEVDHINGAVVRAGEKFGVQTPYNRALTLLVHMLEAKQAARVLAPAASR